MITYLKFRTSISIGSNETDYWSNTRGSTSALFAAITVQDRGDKGVVLEYRAGAAQHDVEIPRENIAQITRPPKVEQPAVKKP